MADWQDVRRLALALPGTSERVSRDRAQWRVADTLFVWERPLARTDLAALGLSEQPGPVLGARVADLGVKDALIADDPAVYFTTPHFDGYPAVLVRLEVIDADELREIVTDAWLARAPAKLRVRVAGGPA